MVDGIRAFSDAKYDYYKLTQDLGGILPKGTVFYHDPDDQECGSIGHGCLKLCWTPDGNCYHTSESNGLCGGTVIFHYNFAHSPLFEKVDLREVSSTGEKVARELSLHGGRRFEVVVRRDGSWEVKSFGHSLDEKPVRVVAM